MNNFNIIKDWYYDPIVKFEIIRHTYKREVAFIVAKYIKEPDIIKRNIRTLKIHSVQHLDFIMSKTSMMKQETPYCLYYSLGQYKTGIPHQDFKTMKRNNRDWIKNHWRFMSGYDFVIDIDAGNHQEMDFAYYSAQQIKVYFDLLNCPYELRFSGCGFHFIIPYKYFARRFTHYKGEQFNPKNPKSVYMLFAKIGLFLQNKFSALIDTSIYDARRVLKIPHTLALYKEKVYVCSPFYSNDSFDNFKLEDYEHHRFIKIKDSYLFNEKGNTDNLIKKTGVDI